MCSVSFFSKPYRIFSIYPATSGVSGCGEPWWDFHPICTEYEYLPNNSLVSQEPASTPFQILEQLTTTDQDQIYLSI